WGGDQARERSSSEAAQAHCAEPRERRSQGARIGEARDAQAPHACAGVAGADDDALFPFVTARPRLAAHVMMPRMKWLVVGALATAAGGRMYQQPGQTSAGDPSARPVESAPEPPGRAVAAPGASDAHGHGASSGQGATAAPGPASSAPAGGARDSVA